MQRMCTAAEMKFYGQSLLGGGGGGLKGSYYLRPNKNCNLTMWPAGCEPGWSCNIRKEDNVNIKKDKEIPLRINDCQPCCPGFFCPHGLTCMIRELLFSSPLLLSQLVKHVLKILICSSICLLKPARWELTALELSSIKPPASVIRKSSILLFSNFMVFIY